MAVTSGDSVSVQTSSQPSTTQEVNSSLPDRSSVLSAFDSKFSAKIGDAPEFDGKAESAADFKAKYDAWRNQSSQAARYRDSFYSPVREMIERGVKVGEDIVHIEPSHFDSLAEIVKARSANWRATPEEIAFFLKLQASKKQEQTQQDPQSDAASRASAAQEVVAAASSGADVDPAKILPPAKRSTGQSGSLKNLPPQLAEQLAPIFKEDGTRKTDEEILEFLKKNK